MKIQLTDDTFDTLSEVWPSAVYTPHSSDGRALERLGNGEGTRADLQRAYDQVRATVNSYAGGDRAPLPPVRYLRAENELHRLLREHKPPMTRVMFRGQACTVDELLAVAGELQKALNDLTPAGVDYLVTVTRTPKGAEPSTPVDPVAQAQRVLDDNAKRCSEGDEI